MFVVVLLKNKKQLKMVRTNGFLKQMRIDGQIMTIPQGIIMVPLLQELNQMLPKTIGMRNLKMKMV